MKPGDVVYRPTGAYGRLVVTETYGTIVRCVDQYDFEHVFVVEDLTTEEP